MKRKLLSLALLLMAVFAITMLCAPSAEAETYRGSCGDNASWSLDTEEGVLYINGTGPMKDYNDNVYDYKPWGGYNEYIDSVVINDGITTVGAYAFNGMDITSIYLPENISSIGQCAFNGCTNLISVAFPENLSTIGVDAFCGCSSLANIVLPDKLRTIKGGAFWGTPITSITIPSSVTYLGGNAFRDCANLTSIKLSRNITEIGEWTFYHCTNLKEVVIPEGVKSIGGSAFDNCTSLTNVSLPKSLENIWAGAFQNCTSLTSVTLPEGILDVSNFGFAGCTGLTEMVFPSSVTHIGLGALSGCSNLDTVTVYSPDCSINTNSSYSPVFGPVNKVAVRGYDDSTAYSAAKQMGYYFESLGPYEDPGPYVNPFKDVKEGKWYYDAVEWAVKKGITAGVSEDMFAPYAECKRGQVVTFLWRVAGEPEPEGTAEVMSDVRKDAYYYKAVQWAVENGIAYGEQSGLFMPDAKVTRAQFVTFLWRAKGEPETSLTKCAFTDVKAGQYYTTAVLWAVENGITSGLNVTTFGTKNLCTRAQVVTFLYNAYGK